VSVDERALLAKQIEQKYSWYDRGSRMWSIAHHSSLYLGAILSAAAALVLKMDFLKGRSYTTDLAASGAAIASLLSTIAAAGGFDRKWRANRISRGKVDELRIDLSDQNADLKAIRDRLKAIIDAHDQGIAGMTK
jgi:hypothetical protein